MIELESIDGIGPKTKELINKLGINTAEDLINHYPFRYDIIKRSDLTVVNDGDRIVIDGIVEGQPTIIYINKSLKKIIFRINTKTSILNVTIYNKIYLHQELKSGKEVTIIGKYNKLKIEIIDERLTTVAAYKTMNFLDVNKNKKRNIVDTISAVYILETYLNKIKN